MLKRPGAVLRRAVPGEEGSQESHAGCRKQKPATDQDGMPGVIFVRKSNLSPFTTSPKALAASCKALYISLTSSSL